MKTLAVMLLSLALLPWAAAQERDDRSQDKDEQAKTHQKKKKDKDRAHKSDRDDKKACADRDDCPTAAAATAQDRDRDRDARSGVAAPAGEKYAAVHISNGPRIEGVHQTSARIAWSTNVPSSAILRYGTDPNHLDRTAESAWGGGRERNGDVVHRVELRNLRPNTTYYFRVDSTEAKGTGTAVQSAVQSFRTK